jgi:serine/threonine protein kinase
MSYCFNPYCSKPNNFKQQDQCHSCGASLLLHQRYRGIKLLGKSQLALTIEVTDEVIDIKSNQLKQDNHTPSSKVLKVLLTDYPKAVELFQQEAQVLQQYFHRDIKPSNIILQPNGKLALIDFGAARKVTHTYLGKVGVNQGVTSIGTPGYIAPEQIDGAALPQSDFFSLGRTLVHLLTGTHPQELAKDLATRELIWRDQAPQVSVAFADLLDEMMSYLPSQRPVNVEAIINNLVKVEQFPQQPLTKLPAKLTIKSKLSWSMLFGVVFLPLSILGLFSLGSNFKQEVAASKITNIPLCNNLTCVNRDPVDNKCDRDAQTITSNTGNYTQDHQLKPYRLEIRRSTACNAVWAKSEAPYLSLIHI